MGHRQPDERVRRPQVVQRPGPRPVQSPRQSDCGSPPTPPAGQVRAGVVNEAGLHPLPGGTTVLDLVRAGLPAALEAGQRALEEPAAPLEGARLLPPLDPPTIRDFVAFEEHVEGVVASVGDGAGVVAEWYEAPTFYFTNPYARDRPVRGRAGPAGLRTAGLRARGRRRRRPGRGLADAGAGSESYLRVHDLERLVGPGPAAAGDESQPRPGQGQGLGHHARALAGDRRRARALPGPRRLPRP